MRVHIFGNSPSPAVAVFGLRMAASEAEGTYGSDAQHLIEWDFYVNDEPKSFPTEARAIDVLQRAQKMLALSDLRLHKIVSNQVEVMNAFSPEDRAKEMKDLDLSTDELPVQCSLGVSWNTMSDRFTFHVPQSQKPFTHHEVLSVVNSLFDPLGYLAPVTIKGRFFLRELTGNSLEWDSPLSPDMYDGWRSWQESLQDLQALHIPCTYVSFSISQARFIELCIFSDASVHAIAAAAYLKVTHGDGHSEVGFIMGKAKLAPVPELTIPRLELCAVVLAVELSELQTEELDTKIDRTTFYTDSKVVLGYIHNQHRRFQVYVNNHVQRIKQSSLPDQWRYVPTEHNPADHGSRSVAAGKLTNTTWLYGPAFFLQNESKTHEEGPFELINPGTDVEIHSRVTVLATTVSKSHLGSAHFERFSKWTSLIKAVAHLRHISHSFIKSKEESTCTGWHLCKTSLTGEALSQAEHTVIRCVQHEVYSEEIKRIRAKQDLSSNSSLHKLHPVMDDKGLLVGRRTPCRVKVVKS